jgi:hypothetical protein
MAHPYHHALSSVKKWGGKVEDYLPIHDWFDDTKRLLGDFRHRALRHHAEGIFLAEQVFGKTLTNGGGRVIPVRWVGEQHVQEDLGRIPAAADWLRCIRPEAWMGRTPNSTLIRRPHDSGSSASPEATNRGVAGTLAATAAFARR